jgi:hypothetical protein
MSETLTIKLNTTNAMLGAFQRLHRIVKVFEIPAEDEKNDMA